MNRNEIMAEEQYQRFLAQDEYDDWEEFKEWSGLLKEEVANAPQEFTDEYTLPKNWDACFKERL